jgi:hypothetical protein
MASLRAGCHVETGWRLIEFQGAAALEADAVGETRG